jgi:hypothetical protein
MSDTERDEEAEEIQPPAQSSHEIEEDIQTDAIVDVSPAFQELADLQERGVISPFKAAKLRAKYSEAFGLLEEQRKLNEDLLVSAKNATERLDEQRAQLDTSDDVLDDANNDSESADLRSKYLQQMNNLWAAEERIGMIEQEMTELKKEKKSLENQLDRIKPVGDDGTDQKKRNLEREQDEIKKENTQRKQEIQTLKEVIELKKNEAEREKKYLKEALEEQEELKNQLSSDEFNLPQTLEKDIDKLKRQNDNQKRAKEKLALEITTLNEKLAQEANLYEEKGKEFEKIKLQSEEEKIKLERNQQNENKMTHDLLAERDRTHELQIDLASLELQIKHAVQEKKREHEIMSRKQRELDREMRNCKRKETQLKIAQDSLESTQHLFNNAKEVVDLPNPNVLLNQRTQLRGEVEVARRKLANQQSRTAMEKVKHEEMLIEEEHLFHKQEQERATLVELSRIRQIKEDEKEQKSRDLLRAQERIEKIIKELKQKELTLHDHKKRCLEIQCKQDDFAKLYDVIKYEKNKYVHMIQSSTQKAAELRDKLRVLANEVEILQGSATLKTKQLKKAELNHAQHCSERDSLRNEKSKNTGIQNQINAAISSRKLEIERLNIMSQRAEEDARNLLVQYEKSVQHRNERGVTLVEREEEVCIFYERQNVQEQMLRDGESKINEFDENLRFLKIQLQEELRQIELLRSKRPEKKKLDNELVDLQIQHLKAREEMKQLEEKLANPDRARKLGGSDLNIEDLKKKLEDVQTRLANVEEVALEKELLFQQVDRLVVKQQAQCDDGKTPALELSRQLNAAQSQLNSRTRATMARIAELSMMKTQLLDSERERTKLQEELEDAYHRLEKGLAPTLEAEVEWKRYLDKQLARGDDNRSDLMEGHYPISEGYTTAKPRPTAYIPKDGSLPVPRPYGALAPFKPTQPGSTMRHIKKPIPKPIDI